MDTSIKMLLGVVSAFAIVALAVPAMFVGVALGEAYNPGSSIFGPQTRFLTLLVIPAMLGVTAVMRWKTASRFADGAFAGSIAGSLFLAIFVALEYVSKL